MRGWGQSRNRDIQNRAEILKRKTGVDPERAKNSGGDRIRNTKDNATKHPCGKPGGIGKKKSHGVRRTKRKVLKKYLNSTTVEFLICSCGHLKRGKGSERREEQGWGREETVLSISKCGEKDISEG